MTVDGLSPRLDRAALRERCGAVEDEVAAWGTARGAKPVTGARVLDM